MSITVYRKPTHRDQYLQWDSYHNLSAKFSVINTLLHRAKLCEAILSCSNKKRNTSEKLSPNANMLNGFCTKWRKDSTGHSVRPLMGLTTRVPQALLLPLEKSRVRAILSYPTCKVFVKVSKRSVADMASKLTSKVAVPSRTSWSPPRTKTLWSTKVMPSIGINVGTLAMMISTQEKPPGPLVKDTKSTCRTPLPFIITIIKLTTLSITITSK